MMFSTLFSLATLAEFALASYSLVEDFDPESFFDHFDFYTDSDPTNGYVNYLSQSAAETLGIIATGTQAYIGVDWTDVVSDPGRQSVRIYSKNTYNHGLFILDLAHMPGSICGVWPAWWLLGTPTWPVDGEIDIIEGVNTQVGDDITCHTSVDCYIEGSYYTGSLVNNNCNAYANSNTGCQISGSSTATNSYGTNFNSAGGGVYAAEWTSDLISVWFWQSGSVPSGATDGSPDPSEWGEPLAQFDLSCEIDDRFTDMEMVFDITFCGDWAGSVWSSNSACAALSSSCSTYVKNNPYAFEQAYWLVNSLQVYQNSTDTDSTLKTVSAMYRNITKIQVLEDGEVAQAKTNDTDSSKMLKRRRGARGNNQRRRRGFHL